MLQSHIVARLATLLFCISLFALIAPAVSTPALAQDTTVFLPIVLQPRPVPLPAAMVFVPAGPFAMGCNSNASQCTGADKPAHGVTLGAYSIDMYEVTNARYAACVNAGACSAPHEKSSNSRPEYYGNTKYANYPVIHVSWSQAAAFCAWDGKRLPTEAEWERAARGHYGSVIYPWGFALPTCDLLNFTPAGPCVGDTTPVGAYQGGVSSTGAMDMSGNVYEWVADWYQSDYYTVSPPVNPQGPASGVYRVLRGGSWHSCYGTIRTSSRFLRLPEFSSYEIGFRCARSQ